MSESDLEIYQNCGTLQVKCCMHLINIHCLNLYGDDDDDDNTFNHHYHHQSMSTHIFFCLHNDDDDDNVDEDGDDHDYGRIKITFIFILRTYLWMPEFGPS